jgi:hypothetical protein
MLPTPSVTTPCRGWPCRRDAEPRRFCQLPAMIGAAQLWFQTMDGASHEA